MTDLFKLILGLLASLFRSRAKLEAEILVLRQQINVLRRRASKRPHLNNTDRFLFVWLYRWFPSVFGAIAIVRPETIVRWHRAGFRAYWRWRSRNRVGRPKVSIELRTLIGEVSCANRLWGAPRIHGELLKLGFEVAQSTVARYMCRRFGPPSQGWRTFLSNHADGIAAVDLFVLPTVAFQILYCLVILRHGRRFWMSFGVTSNPTAEWISRQITEAFPCDHAPEYLIRDRDRSYGSVFLRRLCAMGIRDRPIAPRSPWQNAYVERLIGTSLAYSRHEHREPALGSASDPRRTAQAWHRCRADHRGKIYGKERAATVAGLEDLSAQSCRRHCVDGFVRSPDDLVSAVVWISDPATFPPRACVARCDRTPERPLDCPSTDRGLRLATDARVHRSRSGLRVWRCRRPAASRNGHTGSAGLATVAMAKRILREAHRFDPTGLS